MIKGLQLLSAFLLLLVSCSRKQATSVPLNTPETATRKKFADSVLMDNHLKMVKLNYLGWDGASLDTVDWNTVDSVLHESRISCCDGKITYAPDSLFKIYIISGESCGMYCNPFSESYAYSADNVKLAFSDEFSFTDITDIFTLPDNKYLVLQESWGRAASVLSVNCLRASLVSLRNDSLIFYLMINTDSAARFKNEEYNSDDIYYERTGLSFCQESPGPVFEPGVHYNPSTRELSYSFGRNYAYCCQVDTNALITGTLKYEAGEFKIMEHKLKFLEPEN
jgi:hypothetical protein